VKRPSVELASKSLTLPECLKIHSSLSLIFCISTFISVATMPADSTIAIDPAGDLTLLLKHHGQDITFQVSSKAMSLASPVWRTMLDPNGPFREAKPDNGEVAFPADDAEALLVLLLAAHLRYQEVPQTLTYKQLLNLCIACDKCDCVGLLRPWISKWEATLKPLADRPGHEEWLFVAWTTGDETTFRRLARWLVQNSITNQSNQCLTVSGKVLGENMPPGIVGQ